MGKVGIKLKSSVFTKVPRPERRPTAFNRSLAKLSEDKLHPGKVLRVLVHINDDYKVLGVVTLNTGGSLSFFPDFYKLNEFDHLTLNKDFVSKKGHLTRVENNGKHKKVLQPIEVPQLPSGNYHLVTFGMKDGDLLMDLPQEIIYPDIEFDDAQEQNFIELLKDALHTDAQMLDFPEEKGAAFIQIQVVPKNKALKEVAIESGFKDFFKLRKLIPEKINAKQLQIKTPSNFDFSLCILCFRIDEELESPFSFCM